MNCYECKYRGNVPGDAHSCCRHPEVDVGDGSIFDAVVILFTNPEIIQNAAKKLNIQAEPHGIENGWFFWPMNFDPVWLKNCDGFTKKDDTE